MKKFVIHRNLEGGKSDLSQEEAMKRSMEIFEKGNLLLFIAELDGELTVQVLSPPSLGVLERLQQATESYKRILTELGMIN
jgi:hypothetical protein